jgi:hypothetical protein
VEFLVDAFPYLGLVFAWWASPMAGFHSSQSFLVEAGYQVGYRTSRLAPDPVGRGGETGPLGYR